MINKHLKVDREYTNDYEILTKEISERTIKFFGITIYRHSADVLNKNENTTPARKPIGLRPQTD